MSLGLFDVLGPVMHGPSSNHTGGANRIGYYAYLVMGGVPDRVELGFHPAYMKAYRGQRSHAALIAGCLGLREYEDACADALSAAAACGLQWSVAPIAETERSRNTMRVTGWIGGENYVIDADSIGGGNISIDSINGLPVSVTGNEYAVLLTSPDADLLAQGERAAAAAFGEGLLNAVSGRVMGGTYLAFVTGRCCPAGLPDKLPAGGPAGRITCRVIEPLYPFRDRGTEPILTTFSDILHLCESGQADLSELAVRYEVQRSGVTEEQVLEQGRLLVRLIRESLQRGESEPAELIGGLADAGDGLRLLKFARSGRGCVNPAFTMGLARAVLLSERNAAACRVVACPTGGSAGALPAALITAAERYGRSDEQLARAFLVAALVGVVIGNQASFSGTVGGCQSEVGIGGAMGAAAIAWMAGGTPEQSVHAGTIALKNVLGLTCDPPASPVEVPCIKRNAMGVAIAFYGADMGLADVQSAIAPDDVVLALADTQRRMPMELKFSLIGGLAGTDSGRALNRKWEEKLATLS